MSEEKNRENAPFSPMDSYVALDLETTGLDPKRDRIIEIGACLVEEGQIRRELSLFINPRRALPERIRALTGITEEMISDAPEIGEAAKGLLDFFGELPILGHNVMFDYSFLKQAAVNQGFAFERNGIDTLALCRRFMPPQEKKNLAAACAWYKVSQEGAHRALFDARAAHFLYQEIFRQHFLGNEEAFEARPLIYKGKREQPALKKQKEGLRELAKYHRISLSVDIESLTRSEASRLTDKLILKYGRMKKR